MGLNKHYKDSVFSLLFSEPDNGRGGDMRGALIKVQVPDWGVAEKPKALEPRVASRSS